MTGNFNCAAFRLLLLLVFLTNLMPNQQFSAEKVVVNNKIERDDKLQADADALLPLFDAMPQVPVYLKDEPIFLSGTNTERGVAYTNCESRLNPSIFVKKIFYQNANRKQLDNILKHELTHAWLCRQQLMSGHDARFREKFRQVGGFGN